VAAVDDLLTHLPPAAGRAAVTAEAVAPLLAALLDADVSAADAVTALLSRGDHLGQAAAHAVGMAWVQARPDRTRYLACLAPVAITASQPPVPGLDALTTVPAPVEERAGELVEAAGSYAQLRRWVDDPDVLTTRVAQGLADDAPATRVAVLASLAAAQACLPDRELIGASAVSAALEGDAHEIEHALRIVMAPVAARAHPPGTGRSTESLYPCWEPLLLGPQRWVETWDHDVLTVVDMLAPHLAAGADVHLTKQVGVLALLWWHEWQGRPRTREHKPPLQVLAQRMTSPRALERAREAVAALEGTFTAPWQRQRTVVVQTAVDEHLDHGGLAWAALAQWVHLAAHAPVPAHQVTPVQGQGPWWRAWQDADRMCEHSKPLLGPDSWDGVGVRVLIACALYTVRAQYPDVDETEVLARAVWLLRSHKRFYGRVPAALRGLKHEIDRCDPADEVSSAWAWVHREWPPTVQGSGRQRYDGYGRGVAWGGQQCAAHVLLTPWAENIAAPTLARAIGAIPLGARVRVRSGQHAGRSGTVVAARVQDSPHEGIEPLTPPAQYKVYLGENRPPPGEGEGEVFDADHLTAL
jgi:hypothetical protein